MLKIILTSAYCQNHWEVTGRRRGARAKVECWQLKQLYLCFSLFSFPYNAKNLNYDINKFPLISKRKILKSNISNILNAFEKQKLLFSRFLVNIFQICFSVVCFKIICHIYSEHVISHIGLGVLLSPQLSNKLPKERGSFGVSASYQTESQMQQIKGGNFPVAQR